MKTSTVIAIVIALLVVIGGYWYWSQGQGAGTPAPSQQAGTNGSPNQGNLGQPDTGTPQQPGGTTTQDATRVLAITADATLGDFITAYNGMALYRYDGDTPGVSNCNTSCSDTWPPLTVSSAANITGPAGLSGTIGTIRRADGSLQVTYNNNPLYYYSKDTVAGKASGQGSGGVWFVVKP